jgi:hypothetical protein
MEKKKKMKASECESNMYVPSTITTMCELLRLLTTNTMDINGVTSEC